jgi:YjbE family integral membrane protein
MHPEFLSAAWLSALFAIVLIDLVLAGDNALIIGLVARNLPKDRQRQVIFWGTFGAIAVRGLMAVFVVYVLDVPGFLLAGGLALIWISRKLLMPDEGAAEKHATPAATFAGALRTIVIADAVMGIDNVLAIGGAAHGSIVLILLGLAISVPIIVWGSHLVIKLVDRYPSVILLGSAVLAWTAYSMIVREPLLQAWLATHPPARFVIAVLAFSISLAPGLAARLRGRVAVLASPLRGARHRLGPVHDRRPPLAGLGAAGRRLPVAARATPPQHRARIAQHFWLGRKKSRARVFLGRSQ